LRPLVGAAELTQAVDLWALMTMVQARLSAG